MNLREDIERQIISTAKEFNLERVILFGSRAIKKEGVVLYEKI